MKSKIKTFVVLGVLVMSMSSCVIYSLFPVWTKESLVYLPDLEGKWQFGKDKDDYIIFEPGFNLDKTIQVRDSEESKSARNLDVTFAQDTYIIRNGDTIRDQGEIRKILEEDLGETLGDIGITMEETLDIFNSRTKKLGVETKKVEYDSESQSYTMIATEEGIEHKYQVHLARIGEDIFLDLFATDSEEHNSAMESAVWFPVHTFMKLELLDDTLILTQFDHEKMSKLFDSNLIRMSHENVDGSILITAKSQELQKFLKRYSKDESVFEKPTVYKRVDR